MVVFYADNEHCWDLNSDVGPKVPEYISSKYKVSWRNASVATKKSRVKDYAAYMRRRQIDNFMEEAGRKHREFDEFKDKTDRIMIEAGHAHIQLQSLTEVLAQKMKETGVDGIQDQMGQLSVSEHISRPKSGVKFAVIEEEEEEEEEKDVAANEQCGHDEEHDERLHELENLGQSCPW